MKLSILTVTYNHEKYIAQAIESVLIQQTPFDYELVIGEDFSTDRTREIVVDYQNRFPEKIRLILSDANTGGKQILRRTFNACNGEYIALLEGDDYWTSPHKLQKQVELLESHPEYAISFHPAWQIYEDGDREPKVYPLSTKPIYQLTDLIEGNFIPTCSTVFRSGLFGELPEWLLNLPIGDWPIHILNAQHGDIGCIDEIMGVYRIHERGMTSLRSPAQSIKVYIDFYEAINERLDFKYDHLIQHSLSEKWSIIAENITELGLDQGSVEEAEKTVSEILDQWPEDVPITEAWKSEVWGKLYTNFSFAAQKENDLKTSRVYLLQAIKCDPYLLLNLGVWSAGIESILGRRATGWIRSFFRKIKGSVIDSKTSETDERRTIEERF